MGKANFYDPQTHSIVLFGAVMQGFSPDSLVKMERESRSFAHEVGVDGDVTRSKLSNRVVKLTVMLMQSSASNGILSAQLTMDELAPNGAGVGSCRVTNLVNGSVILKAGECWIEGWPEAELKKTAGPREWVIICADGDRYEAGS